MANKAFKKEDLLGLLDGDDSCGLEQVSDRIVDTGRWSIHHDLIFKDTAEGKFYATAYSVGATEQQDEGPFEYAPDMVECDEVRPVEKTVIVYEAVP